MIRNLSLPILLSICIGLFPIRATEAAGPLAIQNAKIIPISGETIERGSILIQDGQIVAFGADIDIFAIVVGVRCIGHQNNRVISQRDGTQLN